MYTKIGHYTRFNIINIYICIIKKKKRKSHEELTIKNPTLFKNEVTILLTEMKHKTYFIGQMVISLID